MRKQVKGVKLSRKKGARLALAKSLAQALILREKIKTTKPRAKFAQSYVEKLVTLAKKNSLPAKREIFAKFPNSQAAQKLITEITPKFTKISSGFTRIVNLGLRRGDSAPMAILEFAYPRQETTKETKTKKEAKNVKKSK